MTLHKICKKVNTQSKDWQEYIIWRNYNFTEFESLDSTIHNSIYKVLSDPDWEFTVSNGMYLTDVISDYGYATKCAAKLNADEILNFDHLENENKKYNIIGYEILDCAFCYSLLTNFGNDIEMVNNSLTRNGLIMHKNQIIDIHKWFINNMADDGHVIGSKIFVVYEKSAQQVDTPELMTSVSMTRDL